MIWVNGTFDFWVEGLGIRVDELYRLGNRGDELYRLNSLCVR